MMKPLLRRTVTLRGLRLESAHYLPGRPENGRKKLSILTAFKASRNVFNLLTGFAGTSFSSEMFEDIRALLPKPAVQHPCIKTVSQNRIKSDASNSLWALTVSPIAHICTRHNILLNDCFSHIVCSQL